MRKIYRVWVAGAAGRLGKELARLLSGRDFELLCTDLEDLDITSAQDVIGFADLKHPDVMINCAGMTDVAACEQEPERAFKVNALGARNMATAARKIGARLVYISTDDVFSGEQNTPYNEFEAPAPKTVYGKSKLAGEGFVRELAPKHIIVRSGWVYGEGKNFLTALLAAAQKGEPISVANDQFGCPTSATELAKLVICLMDSAEYGLYHGACEGCCSRYEFAQEILRLTGKQVPLLPVPATEIAGAPERPSYTVLDNFMLRISGIHRMANWKDALASYLRSR